jgi:hypothetical protein
MNEYKRLDSIESEDIEKVREYVDAKTEKKQLEMRIDYLDELLREHEDLGKAVWTTLEGKSIPIHDLEDSHLKNIVSYLRARGQSNLRIVKEYEKRFGEALYLPADKNFY